MQMIGNKRWEYMPDAPAEFIERLSPVHPLVAQVLYNRGIVNPEAIDAILGDSLPISNPFDVLGVSEAVQILRRAIEQQDPIIVYGDYDVDGVTASAILTETLHSLGGAVEPYIPSRADEGYGLNPDAIRALAADGARVLITVDCGIRSVTEVELARQLGMQVIITDHHHVGEVLPRASVVINPKRPECGYQFKELAGVGVAYKLAQGLLRTNAQAPLPSTCNELDEEELLDLVALGTVADMVPLVGENHTLVAKGLERLNAAHRPGLKALMDVAGIEPGKINAKAIGFSLAPRLNAAGRISEAQTALDVLMAKDMAQALPLAQELDALNQTRRDMTLAVREAVHSMTKMTDTLPPLIFAASETFPSGVVGLAASRLLDEYYRPAVVVSIEGEYSKGSARSIPEFHITEALDSVADLLVRHGGHAAAAGFTVLTSQLQELEQRLLRLAEEQLAGRMLTPVIQIDDVIPLSELSWDLHTSLERLRPFGYGNPAPIFASRHVRILSARAVGASGQHLKLYIADEQGRTWDGIAFRQGYWDGRLPSWVDLAYVLELNEWNGRISLQLNVQDIHFCNEV